MTRSNRHCRSRRGILLGAAASCAFLVPMGCTAMAAAAPQLIKLASNLLGTASDNYSEKYAEDIKTLLLALSEGQQPSPSSIASPASHTQAVPKEQLALSVGILQQQVVGGQETAVAIEDGAVLQDGRGDPAAGDKIKISFSANTACWVYVIAIDSTGWVTPVFPSSESSASNPVLAGRTHQVPEGSRWYGLDENRGVEEFYFVAAHERRPDIEEILARFSERNVRGRDAVRQELLGTAVAARSPLRRVGKPAVLKRGIVPTGPGAKTTVQTESGNEQQVTLQSILARLNDTCVVVTRWFHHQ